MFKSIFISLILLLSPLASSFAALHHFEFTILNKSAIKANEPIEIEIKAVNADGKPEKINIPVTFRAGCRAENFEVPGTLQKGKAKFSFTPKYMKEYLLMVTDNTDNKPKPDTREIFSTKSVEVSQ